MAKSGGGAPDPAGAAKRRSAAKAKKAPSRSPSRSPSPIQIQIQTPSPAPAPTPTPTPTAARSSMAARSTDSSPEKTGSARREEASAGKKPADGIAGKGKDKARNGKGKGKEEVSDATTLYHPEMLGSDRLVIRLNPHLFPSLKGRHVLTSSSLATSDPDPKFVSLFPSSSKNPSDPGTDNTRPSWEWTNPEHIRWCAGFAAFKTNWELVAGVVLTKDPRDCAYLYHRKKDSMLRMVKWLVTKANLALSAEDPNSDAPGPGK